MVQAVDAYLDKPGVAESLGKQMLERYLEVDLTPAPDASQNAPHMSPIERFTLEARQVRDLKKELGIDEGGVRGFLRGLINAETVNGVLKLAQIVLAGKAAPATGSAGVEAPKLPMNTDQQAQQGSTAKADQINRESQARDIQPSQGDPLKTGPAPGNFNDLAGHVDYGFKAADTDIVGTTPKVNPEGQGLDRLKPPAPSSN